jgi:hypothetical protein
MRDVLAERKAEMLAQGGFLKFIAKGRRRGGKKKIKKKAVCCAIDPA